MTAMSAFSIIDILIEYTVYTILTLTNELVHSLQPIEPDLSTIKRLWYRSQNIIVMKDTNQPILL